MRLMEKVHEAIARELRRQGPEEGDHSRRGAWQSLLRMLSMLPPSPGCRFTEEERRLTGDASTRYPVMEQLNNLDTKHGGAFRTSSASRMSSVPICNGEHAGGRRS